MKQAAETVPKRVEPGCADVSYTVLVVLRNSLMAIEVTNAVQLTIKVEGDRLLS
jgi:hypothetical protein